MQVSPAEYLSLELRVSGAAPRGPLWEDSLTAGPPAAGHHAHPRNSSFHSALTARGGAERREVVCADTDQHARERSVSHPPISYPEYSALTSHQDQLRSMAKGLRMRMCSKSNFDAIG
jgi:hypothetical protein